VDSFLNIWYLVSLFRIIQAASLLWVTVQELSKLKWGNTTPQAVRGKTCCASRSEILGAAHHFQAAGRFSHVAFVEGLRCFWTI